MATISAEIPETNEAIAARRHWRWAAILLQVEAFGALMLGAVYLLTSTATVSPAAALMGLFAATLLFPLGTAIERGSRGAGLILAVAYSLRLFQAVSAPASTFMRMAPLLLLEGFVFGRAIYAMTRPGAPLPAPSASRRVASLLITLLPIAAAMVLFSRGMQSHLAVAVSGAEGEAVRSAHWLGRLLITGGIVLALLHQLPTRIFRAIGSEAPRMPRFNGALPWLRVPEIRLRWPWTHQVRLDFAIGITTLVVSVYLLDKMVDMMSGPDVMLVPGVLIFPLVALLCIPLGFVWIAIGIAEIKKKKWAQPARIVAAIPLLLVLAASVPIIAALAKDFFRSWFTR